MDSTIILRPATPADCNSIADAHVDSIRSLGAKKYPKEIVDDWSAPRTGERYEKAMGLGEKFFVATDKNDSTKILGFSSWRLENGKHRTLVYVRGEAARKKLGSDLLRLAEHLARQNGAKEIHVDASLAAAGFYAKNGFMKISDGMHKLSSGREMSCVFMKKSL